MTKETPEQLWSKIQALQDEIRGWEELMRTRRDQGYQLTEFMLHEYYEMVGWEEQLLAQYDCMTAQCGHYTCTEGGALGPWAGNDPRYN